MPKVDPRNEVGAIVHTVLNRVLSDHTAKNIYGNVYYAKMFLQGTITNVFDGRTPGGGNAIWKLTVRLRDALQRTCTWSRIEEGRCPSTALTLGPVPFGELNQLACAGTIINCLRISVPLSLPCCRLAIASSPLLPAIVIITTAIAARRGRGRLWRRQSLSA
jgi:hypothetical protein